MKIVNIALKLVAVISGMLGIINFYLNWLQKLKIMEFLNFFQNHLFMIFIVIVFISSVSLLIYFKVLEYKQRILKIEINQAMIKAILMCLNEEKKLGYYFSDLKKLLTDEQIDLLGTFGFTKDEIQMIKNEKLIRPMNSK